jgi:hypothetical protein
LNSRAAIACFFSLLCFAFVAGVVFGQGTDLGTIRGIVTDTTGAIIPGAAVSVVDALTSSIRETRTTESTTAAPCACACGLRSTRKLN